MNNLGKEKKQQLLVVAIITIVVGVGIWFGLISSQQQKLAAMEKKTSELRTKVENAQNLIKRAESIEEELEEAKFNLQEREETMASGDLYQWFLSKMIASLSSNPLSNFTTLPPTLVGTRLIPNFPYGSAAYSVKLNGHYHEFGKFLADLENQFPFSRIQSVEIAPVPGSNERLNFSFEFITLYHTNSAVIVR